ncbi:MAG: hypothetical protein JWO19_4559 [Bryobacterales bacterium]|nr:hypothetical protein [Bryobacterales bacterium]
MRRASLVAPLLLIGIGLLFLARNIFPELQLLDYLAKYWPLLLVVWGGLRLLEILFWSATGRPLPPQGVTGGEWVLVIFLCAVGVSLHAVRGLSGWLPGSRIELGGLDIFGENYDYPLSAEKSSTKTPRVVLESFRGNARITSGDVQSVKVTGHSTIRSLDQASADRTNQQAPLEVDGDANEIRIHTWQNRVSGSNRRISADLDIVVPKGASIEAHGRSGDFDINGVDGSIDISSDNASVRLEDIGGNVVVEVRGSDIVRAAKVKGAVELKGRGSDIDLQDIAGQVTINGTFTGNSQLHNLAKPLRIITPYTEFSAEKVADMRVTLGNLNASDLTGPVRMTSSRSWDVALTNFTNSLEVNLNGGDVDLRPGLLPLAKMDVHSRSGHIELALPPTAKFDLTATSNRGSVDNEFGAPLKLEPTGRRGATLRGSNGGSAVNISTESGQVLVRSASAADSARPVPNTPRPPSPPPVPSKPPQAVEQ